MLIFNIPQNLSPLPSGPQLLPPGDAGASRKTSHQLLCSGKKYPPEGSSEDQTAEGEREATLVIYAKKRLNKQSLALSCSSRGSQVCSRPCLHTASDGWLPFSGSKVRGMCLTNVMGWAWHHKVEMERDSAPVASLTVRLWVARHSRLTLWKWQDPFSLHPLRGASQYKPLRGGS